MFVYVFIGVVMFVFTECIRWWIQVSIQGKRICWAISTSPDTLFPWLMLMLFSVWLNQPNRSDIEVFSRALPVFSQKTISNYCSKQRTEITEHVKSMVNSSCWVIIHVKHSCKVQHKDCYNTGKKIDMPSWLVVFSFVCLFFLGFFFVFL